MRENARLRLLLKQSGVKDAEVESYLNGNTHRSDDKASDGLSAQSILPSSTGSTCGQEHLASSSSNESHQKFRREPFQQDCADTVQPSKSPGILDVQKDKNFSQASTLSKSDQPIESQRAQARAPQPLSQEHTMGLHWSTDLFEKDKRSHNNMTSCMKAALIILSMNGSLSIEEAKAKLDCPLLDDCYVSNLTLFQIMDQWGIACSVLASKEEPEKLIVGLSRKTLRIYKKVSVLGPNLGIILSVLFRELCLLTRLLGLLPKIRIIVRHPFNVIRARIRPPSYASFEHQALKWLGPLSIPGEIIKLARRLDSTSFGRCFAFLESDCPPPVTQLTASPNDLFHPGSKAEIVKSWQTDVKIGLVNLKTLWWCHPTIDQSW